MSFQERLRAISLANASQLCVGLDLDTARLPEHLRRAPGGPAAFADAIIEATADLVCAYKPNLAFALAEGLSGLGTLSAMVAAIRRRAPRVPVILDAKFGDIDNSATAYARFAFDVLGVDAVTVNPYLGEEALAPFLERAERGVFVLCKTSNAGSAEVQDLALADGEPLYLAVARRIAAWRAGAATRGVVVGATYPAHIGQVRAVLPEAPLLIPGVGAQGGALAASVRAGADASGGNLIINASRAVLYAGSGFDFAARARAAALALRDQIRAAGSENP